ncbi:N-alpha-acetyltransferase, non-catalitic subunit [Sporothrix stenoceras]
MADDAARQALRLPREEAAVNQGLEELSLTPEAGQPPPRPMPPAASSTRIISDGIVSVDITARFTAAAATLEPGELIKDGYFTLFESVGALEIMDPKMDSGCVSAEELVDNDHQQIMRSLLPAEVIGIIDQLLCLEMAWHLGYPLSQTLLTSIYMTGILIPTPRGLYEADYMRRNSAEGIKRSPAHAILRAYCIALIKTVSDILISFKSELYFEEEDIATNTYHLPMLEDVSREEIRQVLQEARAAIVDVGDGWAENVSLALEARLEFRETFLTAIELAELRISPDSLKVPWTQMADAVKNINESHHLGTAVPAAFNTKMQGLLASTMPPRPIVQPSFEEAVDHWSRLCKDGAEVVDILKYEDPQSLLNFVLTFQAKKPQPLGYIRVLIQSLIFADNIMLGQHSIRQIMDDDLSIVVLPANLLLDPINDEIEVVKDPRFALAKQMEEFRNRSRSRRMLCHVLQDWEQVQMDVEDIDGLVQSTLEEVPGNSLLAGREEGGKPLPLSSWAFLYKIRLMEWVVQLGFELEVYQADELAGMYWYLCYLAKRRVAHCDRIRGFTLRSLGEMRQRAGGRALPGDQEAVVARSLAFLRTQMLEASVTWELADALSCLYAALHRTGLLKTPVRPYSTDELRYELRMRPFAAIGLPQLPKFEEFQKEAQQSTSSIMAILDYAEKAIGGAKKGCEALTRFTEEEAFSAHHHERWLSRTKGIHKSAIFAGLAVASLKKVVSRVEKDGGSVGNGAENDVGVEALKLTAQVPKPDKCYHEWWIVPKVAPAK